MGDYQGWDFHLQTTMSQQHKDRWSDEYLSALRIHLLQPPPGRFEAAHALGRMAVSHGMETLEVAKLHDLALATLLPRDASQSGRESLTARAAEFFSETINPIEQTHPAAREAQADIQELHVTLAQRTSDLEDSNEKLKIQTSEREALEAIQGKKEQESNQLLTDSKLLESQLQLMARSILSANEAERKKMSHRLNDEIAQSLLGINLRMAALKNQITANQANLNKEIAIIQRLVEGSVRIIKHLAHEFSIQPSR